MMQPSQTIERLGTYLLLHRIAEGASNEVFLAIDLAAADPQQLLVVKRLRVEFNDKDAHIDAFLDEARVCARLDHPGIVRIFGFGSIEGRFYIAQEYVQGESLATLLRLLGERGVRFPVRAALAIGAELARALHAAHSCRGPRGRPAPIIHCDVTPGRVLISYTGAIKIADFALAQAEERSSTSSPGQVRGALAWLTPEQLLGEPLGPYTDVYQLGVLLYKLLVGRDPINVRGEVAMADAIVAGAVVPPDQVIDGFPDAMASLLLSALHRQPAERFASAQAFAEALDDLLSRHGSYGPQQLVALLATATGERRALQQTFLARLVEAHARARPRVVDSEAVAAEQGAKEMDSALDTLFPGAADRSAPAEIDVELSGFDQKVPHG